MKKIIFVVAALLGFGLSLVPAHAQITHITLGQGGMEDALFGVNIKAINRIMNTDVARFDFETVNIKERGNISYWKLRVWCNEGIQVGLVRGTNQCNQAVNLTKPQAEGLFSLYLANPQNKRAEFSFKLKAYDASGNWLHSEREAFLW